MAYIGRQPTVGNFRICDAISVVNGQAAYTMQVGGVNVVPESHNNMIVSLNGVIQKPGSSFTVSSSTITFSSNLSTGDVIDFIQILGDVANIGTPSDGTVTTAKLADSSVTSAKLSSGNISLSGGGFKIEDGYAYGFGDNSYRIEGKDDGANARIGFVTGGSEIARFTADGLTFNGDTAAANALDDYEEGTWTPTFTHNGSAVSNVTISKANYTKVGRLVYVNMSARYTGSSLTGGNLIGDGLPFTSAQGNTLGVTGGYLHDPGSGNTDYDAGIAGSHDSNTNFFMIVTPGGRYQQRWLQNYYLSFACWYFI
jgi:hypothetical protein